MPVPISVREGQRPVVGDAHTPRVASERDGSTHGHARSAGGRARARHDSTGDERALHVDSRYSYSYPPVTQ